MYNKIIFSINNVRNLINSVDNTTKSNIGQENRYKVTNSKRNKRPNKRSHRPWNNKEYLSVIRSLYNNKPANIQSIRDSSVDTDRTYNEHYGLYTNSEKKQDDVHGVRNVATLSVEVNKRNNDKSDRIIRRDVISFLPANRQNYPVIDLQNSGYFVLIQSLLWRGHNFDIPEHKGKDFPKPNITISQHITQRFTVPRVSLSRHVDISKFIKPTVDLRDRLSLNFGEPDIKFPQYISKRYNSPNMVINKYIPDSYDRPDVSFPKYVSKHYTIPQINVEKYKAKEYLTPKPKLKEYSSVRYDAPGIALDKYVRKEHSRPMQSVSNYVPQKYNTPKITINAYHIPNKFMYNDSYRHSRVSDSSSVIGKFGKSNVNMLWSYIPLYACAYSRSNILRRVLGIT